MTVRNHRKLNSWVVLLLLTVCLLRDRIGRKDPCPLRQDLGLYEIQDLWLGASRSGRASHAGARFRGRGGRRTE